MDNKNSLDKIVMVHRIDLSKLVPFEDSDSRPSQLFGGVRLEDLADSIKRLGLQKPIIVRPVDDDKYQIISGHNRTEATRLLGYESINAIVKDGLTDEEALGVYFDTNLNQQSFKDWSYAQRLDAVRYTDRLIKEKSEQGKRNDKSNKEVEDDGTSVQNRPKSKTPTTRDKMSVRLGVATATFSKYRRIIKLEEREDNILQNPVSILAEHLDGKKLNLEAAYRISQIKSEDIKTVLGWLVKNPKVELKGEESDVKVKQLVAESKASNSKLSEKKISGILS